MRKMANVVLLCLCVFVLSTGCAELSKISEKKAESAGEELTTEAVREEINKGMFSNDVERVLGVTKNLLSDEKGRLVMVYDRISAIDVKLDSSDRDTLVLIGLAREDDDPATGRKDFSIIIKFDHDSSVYAFDFGPSKF